MGTIDHLSQEVKGLTEAVKDFYKQLKELRDENASLRERLSKLESSFEDHCEIHPAVGYFDRNP